MLTEIEDIDIKELSEIYDSETRDSFVSLYLNLKRGLDYKFIERRVKGCTSVLREQKDLLINFDETIHLVRSYLSRNGRERKQKGVAIFASKTNEFFRAYKLSVPVENLLIVDTSPYVRPLARLRDEWETFGLILINNNHAKSYIVSSGVVKHKKKTAAYIMSKHKKGGWSQMRFQRLRKGAIKAFFKDVVEDVRELLAKEKVSKLIIAGPGGAKLRFKEFLPYKIKQKVIETIDVDFDVLEDELISDAVKLVSENEKETSRKAVNRLREEILKDGLAVYGVKESIKAARNGQVELLLINKGYKVKGWICEHCQCIEPGSRNICPYCSRKTSKVDVVEEIIEFAERTNTALEFVDYNPMLKELGGVGALLRFK